MIALANPDKSFTVTVFAPFEGEYGLNQLTDKESIERYFNLHFADAVPHMPNLVEDCVTNPTSNFLMHFKACTIYKGHRSAL